MAGLCCQRQRDLRSQGKFFGYILNDDRVAISSVEHKPSLIARFRPLKPFKPFSPFARLRMAPLPPPYRDVFESRSGAVAKMWPDTSWHRSDPFAPLMGSHLIAADGRFLGIVNKNPFDPVSLSNEFGEHGSQFQPYSIFNEYGQYGGQYSLLSPFNEHSTSPPKFWHGRECAGTLTANAMITERIDPPEFVAWLKS
jgi:hypothetical protein